MNKTVRIIALVLVALMILSLIPTVAFGAGISVSSTTGGSAVADFSSASQGEKVTLTATPDRGYHFVRWLCPGSGIDGTTDSPLTFSMGASDLEVKAIFEADPGTYTVTVNYNSDQGSAYAGNRSATGGQAVALYAMANTGYAFAGWTSNFNFTSPNAETSFAMPEYNVTLTANFTPASSPTEHKLVRYPYFAPAADAPGQREHWRCDGHCDLWFWDSAATDVIADHNAVEIPTGHYHDKAHLVFVPYLPATCVEAGHSAHYVCPVCGWTFDLSLDPFDPYIKPTGHRWSHWKVVRRPTPTQPGLEECTCYNCGEEKYFTIYYNENPKTGDESNMALWISLAAVALLGTAGAVWYIKRKKKN